MELKGNCTAHAWMPLDEERDPPVTARGAHGEVITTQVYRVEGCLMCGELRRVKLRQETLYTCSVWAGLVEP